MFVLCLTYVCRYSVEKNVFNVFFNPARTRTYAWKKTASAHESCAPPVLRCFNPYIPSCDIFDMGGDKIKHRIIYHFRIYHLLFQSRLQNYYLFMIYAIFYKKMQIL